MMLPSTFQPYSQYGSPKQHFLHDGLESIFLGTRIETDLFQSGSCTSPCLWINNQKRLRPIEIDNLRREDPLEYL